LHNALEESKAYNARLLEIIARQKRELADADAIRRQLAEKESARVKRTARIKQLEGDNLQLKGELKEARRTPKTYNDLSRELALVKAKLVKEESERVALRQALSLYELSALAGMAVGGGGGE
jgi:hypothetical protein